MNKLSKIIYLDTKILIIIIRLKLICKEIIIIDKKYN